MRSEGQQLYLFTAVFAVVLVFIARVLLSVGNWASPDAAEWLLDLWEPLSHPFQIDALPTFFLAFWLGPTLAGLINWLTRKRNVSKYVISAYGSRMENFFYNAAITRRLIYVVLDNRKVYVGWVAEIPVLKSQRDDVVEYLTLMPLRSGYLTEDTLEPRLTRQYSTVYRDISRGRIDYLKRQDFTVIIAMSDIKVARPYSLRISQDRFEFGRGT